MSNKYGIGNTPLVELCLMEKFEQFVVHLLAFADKEDVNEDMIVGVELEDLEENEVVEKHKGMFGALRKFVKKIWKRP